MNRQRWLAAALISSLICSVVVGLPALVSARQYHSVNGTIWVANRGADSIAGFSADTGNLVYLVNMASGSQPGDLGFAKRKLYVAEEMGLAPGIAILDTAAIDQPPRRIPTGVGSRPHHVHVSSGGNFVAVSLFGTDKVAVVDARDDTRADVWDSNPATTNGRIHAAVFSTDGRTLYLTSDATGKVIAMDRLTGLPLWALDVPGAHELAVTHDQRLLYVSRRTLNQLAVIHLDKDPTVAPTGFTDVVALGLPDSLRLSANEALLTVGLRTRPAQLAVVDTRTFNTAFVDLSPGQPTSLAGHQWTSPDGRYTLAAFEGGTNQGVAIVDHKEGNRIVATLNYPRQPHGIVHTHP